MANHLNRNDIGHRVVVRRFIGIRDDRPKFTDLLGELTDYTENALTVVTRHGEIVVPLAEVHRAKVVPARRGPTAREIAALERAATDAWPPCIVEPLGEWRLRAAAGYTGRANSALPLGDPGVPIPQALAQVIDFYRRHDLPPQIDVPLPLAAGVERELLKEGWQPQCTVLILTADLADLVAATAAGSEFDLGPEPSEQAIDMIMSARFAGHGPPTEDFVRAVRHVLTSVAQLTFAQLYDAGGALVTMARGSVTGDGWLGLFAVETVPAARRRGLAQAAVGAIARWAALRGATRAYLQVESSNKAAIGLYGKLGFTQHHRYTRYRAP